MNYLAHAFLARSDEGLMLGGLLGDYVRGLVALRGYTPAVRDGIRLHRFIDKTTDTHSEVKVLLRRFPRPFRRYAGIIVDLAFDHELAKHWDRYGPGTVQEFDQQVRTLLADNADLVPPKLGQFMDYAEKRGLFATYADEDEMLRSLAGVGTRLRRSNPLDRVAEIWPEVKEPCAATFEVVFPLIQSDVDDWVRRKSTITGS